MLSGCLYNYVRKRVESISKYFASSKVHGGIESIHNLRVEIKRLRAVQNLIKCLKPDISYKSAYKYIRPLFKISGKLRDAQVQMETIHGAMSAYNLELSEYYNIIKYGESELKNDYVEFCRNYDVANFNKVLRNTEKAMQAMKDISFENKIKDCFQDKLNQVVYQKKETFLSADDYHKIRINIKAARYILEVIRECLPERQSYEDLNEGLKTMHQALGIWHDKEVEIAAIEKFITREKGRSFFDMQAYEKYINMLKTEKSEHLGSFENRWGYFIKLLEIHGYSYPD